MRLLSLVALTVLSVGTAKAQTDAMTTAKDPVFDANPTFQAVSIKPSDPDETELNVQIRGHHFATTHTNMYDLICYAFDVHMKQIVNAPAWFSTERFDVDAVPDTEVLPTRDQFHVMVQKMLADRFAVSFHRVRRKLSVYAITIAKGGLKIKPNASAPDAATGYGINSGELTVKNMSFTGVARVMQRTVLDRPVVDETGDSGHYSFALKWKPDESQFIQLRGGVELPERGADIEARASLYTAMQEQLGLKLEAKRTLDDVLVIDHAEQPSAN